MRLYLMPCVTPPQDRSKRIGTGGVRLGALEKAMQTKEGRARFKYQVQLYYGNELYESWTDGNKLQAAIAPMFKASDDESITTATAIKMAMAKRSDLSAPVGIKLHIF